MMHPILKKIILFAPFPAVVLLASQFAGNNYVKAKIEGLAPDCPWTEVLREPLQGLTQRVTPVATKIIERDTKLDIVRVQTPGREFWIKRGSHDAMDGQVLLAYLVADHRALYERFHERSIHAGDVVIDCGGHVGVFSALALDKGAAKVVAVEPDPVNVECLRRNFRKEIAEGRMVVYPKGVWSSETTLEFFESRINSGANTVIADRLSVEPAHAENQKTSIPVTTLDKLVAELGLDRVSLIKMDIEGAEREALQGGAGTLKRFRPRLMLDSYHLPDDMPVFRKLIGSIDPRYQYVCSGCEFRTEKLAVPHVSFWSSAN